MFLNSGGAHTPAANQKGGGFKVLTISQPTFVFVFSPAKCTGVKYLRSRFAITPASLKMNPQPVIYQLIRGFALAAGLNG